MESVFVDQGRKNAVAAFLARQTFPEAKRAAAASVRSRIPIFLGLNIIQSAANTRSNSQFSVPRVDREIKGDENEDGDADRDEDEDEGLDNRVNKGETKMKTRERRGW